MAEGMRYLDPKHDICHASVLTSNFVMAERGRHKNSNNLICQQNNMSFTNRYYGSSKNISSAV